MKIGELSVLRAQDIGNVEWWKMQTHIRVNGWFKVYELREVIWFEVILNFISIKTTDI